MADKKIADLQEATTLSDTDIAIVEDNANTKKITWANLKTAIIGAFSSILGNRTYTEQNVVTNGESITNSINELDVDLASHKAENVSDDDPHKWNSTKRFAIGNFNRDSSLPSGTQIVTGLGFKPKIIMFTAYVTGIAAGKYSEGTGSVAKNNCVFQTTTGLRYPAGDYCIIIRQGAYSTSDYLGRVSNMTNDGFELAWTRSANSASEVIEIQYTAFG